MKRITLSACETEHSFDNVMNYTGLFCWIIWLRLMGTDFIHLWKLTETNWKSGLDNRILRKVLVKDVPSPWCRDLSVRDWRQTLHRKGEEASGERAPAQVPVRGGRALGEERDCHTGHWQYQPPAHSETAAADAHTEAPPGLGSSNKDGSV